MGDGSDGARRERAEPTEGEISTFVDAAIARIESVSIRAWARSDHNAPIVASMGANALRKGGESADPLRFSAYLVCLALGL